MNTIHRPNSPVAVAARRRQQAHRAARHLAGADPRLDALIRHYGPHRPVLTANPFLALVGAIMQQQVSMSAASAMYRRLKAACPHGRLTPAGVLTLNDATLRGAGLSRQKVQYVRGVAAAFADGTLTAGKLRAMSDDEVLTAATALHGVGRWTAEMLLIFCLERPDVWPIDDLGLRKAVRAFLKLAEMPSAHVMNELAEPWRPYRTYASWYLWRSLEGPLMPGMAV